MVKKNNKRPAKKEKKQIGKLIYKLKKHFEELFFHIKEKRRKKNKCKLLKKFSKEKKRKKKKKKLIVEDFIDSSIECLERDKAPHQTCQ